MSLIADVVDIKIPPPIGSEVFIRMPDIAVIDFAVGHPKDQSIFGHWALEQRFVDVDGVTVYFVCATQVFK